MTTQSKDTDHTITTTHTCARTNMFESAGTRALTFSFVTTATTDKTFRERQISICLNKTSKQPYVNSKPHACAYARASRDHAPRDAGILPCLT